MRRLMTTATAALAFLTTAGAAQAATDVSSNWSGYVTKPTSGKTRYRSVSGTWVVPQGACAAGDPGYSATWVGLGGYTQTSQALEQTGTEFDCLPSGRAVYSAWYELVPAASRDIRIAVRPGDTISTSVTVRGHKVSIFFRNRTLGSTFRRVVAMPTSPDISTADWIEEAPANCDSAGLRCQQLPISNFGTVQFEDTYATTTAGHKGSIVDRLWTPIQITLSEDRGGGGPPAFGPGDPRFVSASSSASATPSDVAPGGTSFSVTYEDNSTTSAQ